MSVDEYCDRDGDYEEGACVDWLIKGYKERGLEMHYIEKQMFDRVRGSFGYWDVDEFYGENGRKWYYDFVIDVEEEDVLLLKYVGEDAWNEMKKGEFVWARRNEDKDEGGWIVRGYHFQILEKKDWEWVRKRKFMVYFDNDYSELRKEYSKDEVDRWANAYCYDNEGVNSYFINEWK